MTTENTYDKAFPIEAKNAQDCFDRGNWYYVRGRYQEAIEDYDHALALDPELADVWDNRGIALHKLGRYQEAKESYGNALVLRALALS